MLRAANTWPENLDDDACEAFYLALASPCRRIVGRRFRPLKDACRLGRQQFDDMVAEAVNEAFADLVGQWHDIDPHRVRPLTFLVLIAGRRLRRLVALDQGQRRVEERLQAHHRLTPAVRLEPLYLARVHETLEQLPERQRYALKGHYVDELPIKALAAHMDVSEAAANSLLQRSRHRFKDLWVVQEPGPTPTQEARYETL